MQSKALEDVVILNIDSNTLESPYQDLENLPSDVVSIVLINGLFDPPDVVLSSWLLWDFPVLLPFKFTPPKSFFSPPPKIVTKAVVFVHVQFGFKNWASSFNKLKNLSISKYVLLPSPLFWKDYHQ